MRTSLIRSRRHALTFVAAVGLCLAPARWALGQALPSRISDEDFWRMVSEFSEPGGFFRSDNFVSNETTFQYVVPDLTKSHAPGGVYVGVGPDQNFTYIVALRPRIAFIVDIRRQNMLEHLMYKAAMELAPDRADFLARLFARPRPSGLTDSTSAPALLQAYQAAVPDTALYRKNLVALKDHLITRHRFALSAEDLASIDYVYEAFFSAGPDLTYSFSTARQGRAMFFGRRMPSYGELMAETDGRGVQRSYLATEENYRALRDLELNNLIVPLVGDFAGDKALRTVGKYLKEHNATVTAFYTSNVEQYLFQQADDWRRFFQNVATLPLDAKSTFIRAVFNYGGYRDPVSATPGPRSTTMLGPIVDLLKAVEDGRVQSYYDIIQLSTASVPSVPPF
jgi:hypothetical protein